MPDAPRVLREELVAIVGEDNVLDGPSLSAYREDYSPFPPVNPRILVRPGNVEEVASVMRLANSTRTPVVARGGGASLTGLQDPGDGIVLETKRLNRILEIDENNFTVRSECGIIMNELEDAVARRGMYVHTVAVPGRLTTLGGVMSGVVGGGLPPDGSVAGTDNCYVLGLRVVLPLGTMFSTGAGGCNIHLKRDFMRGGNGPDLTGVFIGDGGVLGVKVDATLQVFPAPLLKSSGACVFASFDDAWGAFSKLTSTRRLPFERLSVRDDARLTLSYTIAAESQEELESSEGVVQRACLESNPVDEFATKPVEKEDIIRLTRGLLAFIASKREFPETYSTIRKFVDRRIDEQRLAEKGVHVISQFRPNMRNAVYTSMSIVYDASVPEGRAAALQLLKDGYRLAVDLGAAPEPHQGFASKVIGGSWSPEFRGIVRGLKTLVDPNRILNQGLWDL